MTVSSQIRYDAIPRRRSPRLSKTGCIFRLVSCAKAGPSETRTITAAACAQRGRICSSGAPIGRVRFSTEMDLIDDIARPCTINECRLSDAMLQLSPHGEIAFPMVVNKENAADAVKITRSSGSGRRRAMAPAVYAGNKISDGPAGTTPAPVLISTLRRRCAFFAASPCACDSGVSPLDSVQRSSLMGHMGIAISP
jgi:hypothetical protein